MSGGVTKSHLYIRITKCASRTILAYYGGSPGFLNSPGEGRSPADRSLLLPGRHQAERDSVFFDDSVSTFTFVRNPYDRAVSSWTWAVREGYTGASFLEFLKGLEGILDTPSAELSKRDLLIKRHSLPQVKWVTGDGGSWACDFAGRVEWLSGHVKIMNQLLGLPERALPLKSLNTSRKGAPDYREYYTSESRTAVRSIYERDINEFGYSFDGPPPMGVMEYKGKMAACLEE